MRNRTIYDVLEKAMENYSYSIKQTNDRKIEIRGSIIIPRIDVEVTHELTFWYGPEDKDIRLIKAITTFKEELKDKVVSVIKEHKEELTDDETAIKKLLSTNKFLKEALSNTETELKKAREEIARLELEKTTTQPYQPYPWYPSPWSTGITWDTPYVGDRPGWLDNTITCEKADDFTTNNSIDITVNTDEGPIKIPCRKFKYNRKNGEEC